jgi:hypothetical protein
MKKLILILSLLLCSCGQSYNSNSKDFLLSGNGIDPSNTSLVEAFSVISNNCISCHSGYHNSWSNYKTDQQWIDSGNVSAGSALSSPLIIRLKNRGGDMPLLSSNLSESEYNSLVNWIDAL